MVQKRLLPRDRLSMKTCVGEAKIYDMSFFFISIESTSDSWPEGESQMDRAQMAHEDTEVSKIP